MWATPGRAAIATQQSRAPAGDRRPAPVLLVEQHPLMCELLEHMLGSQLGLPVSARADNGADAIRLAGELQPRLVLMDFSLPDMDGLQATRALLALAPATRVVLLIDTPEGAYRAAALACGAAACIEKTLIWADLPTAVAELLYDKGDE